MREQGRPTAAAGNQETHAKTGRQAPAGDLNFVFKGLRLRGPGGPAGLLLMGRQARKAYDQDVMDWPALALYRLDQKSLAAVQNQRKRLRVTVVHQGVFEAATLLACPKPLIEGFRQRSYKPMDKPMRHDPGLFPDASEKWVEVEVRQERGMPEVMVEAWSPALAEHFSGQTIRV